MQTRRVRGVIALWALTVWSLAGAWLARELIRTSEAVEVVAASSLCPPACPAVDAPTWLAEVVFAGWVLLSVGSLVALGMLALRRWGTRGTRDTRRTSEQH